MTLCVCMCVCMCVCVCVCVCVQKAYLTGEDTRAQTTQARSGTERYQNTEDTKRLASAHSAEKQRENRV